MAYKQFKQMFYGERFAALKAAGAQVQRVLAGVDRDRGQRAGHDVRRRVDQASTVNTLPPETLTLFKDPGTMAATLEQGIEEAERTLAKLAGAGVDLNDVTRRLQIDGVASFSGHSRS
ncbi:MAG: hypothetical protein U0703_01245 [Anaerolineae bacterium]